MLLYLLLLQLSFFVLASKINNKEKINDTKDVNIDMLSDMFMCYVYCKQ